MNTVLDGLSQLTESLNAFEPESVLADNTGFAEKIRTEAEQIKSRIRNIISSLDEKQGIVSNYLSFLQNRITCISNRVNELQPGAAYTAEIIDDLLDFLDLEFASDFNRNLKAPASFIAGKIAEHASCAGAVHRAMKDAHADQLLIDLIINYMNQNGYQMKTFADVNYYQRICESLNILIHEISEDDMQDRIVQKLIHLNFNALPFLKYFTSAFALKYDQEQEAEQWKTAIRECLTRIKRAPQHESLAYDHDDKSVKEKMETVIQQKLSDVRDIETTRMEEDFFDSSEPYFTLNMTVYEIAFLAKLFTLENIVDARFNQFIFLFISKYLRTNNNPEPLKVGSIRKKFNTPDLKAIIAVKTLLVKLLAKCDEFGEK